MAVETKYVVVRKGEEKMTFANKKDADAWDKMLDMADAFTDWLLQNNPEMDDSQAEALGLQLAEQKDTVQHILRTSKLPEPVSAEESAPAEAAVADNAEEAADAPEKKVRAVKVA